MNRLAENYAARGDFRNGIVTALKAVHKDPYFIVAHVNLGKMYFSLGEPENAEKHFQKAIDINPTNSDVAWIYGEFLVFRKRVPEAIKWFEKVRFFELRIICVWILQLQLLCDPQNRRLKRCIYPLDRKPMLLFLMVSEMSHGMQFHFTA